MKNSNTIFEENQAKLYLLGSKQNELIKNVITEFDKIDADFIIVVGGFIETLDDSLAKNLNAPFLLSKDTEFKKGTLNFTVLNDIEEIFSTSSNALTPLRFENLLYKKARSNLKTVVLPESDDERILKASAILLENKAVNIVLLGDKYQINKKAREYGINLEDIKVYDPQNSDLSDEFATTLYELRREKGMTKEKASELMKDRTYFGTMLVYKGICDAMVSGASTTTAETIRPALQFIKMKPGISTVSGSFIMCLDTKIQLFADCAITPNPTADQLASIA
ncbi:MAG: phosphate acyltransferase, partial [Campylobacter hyointestinalis]